jgi:hypothetical protein
MELDVWMEFEGKEMDDWKGGDWSKTMQGEYYKGRSPFFPNGHEMFSKVKQLINTGKYETETLDSLTHSVKVPKSVILEMLEIREPELTHIKERLTELKSFVETLPDNKNYTLICNEF